MKLSKTFILILLFLFLVKGYFFLDPDFGWRLRAGEIFFKEGVPATDIFTYTMPSFPWVEHSSRLSIFIWLLHSFGGFWLSSLVFSIASLITILLITIPFKKFISEKLMHKGNAVSLGGSLFPSFTIPLDFENWGIWVGIPTLLGSAILFTFFGVRVQVFSWLMMAVLLVVLLKKKAWKRLRYFLPLFFWLWANLHGSFASGLSALGLWLFLKSIRERKFFFKEYLIFVASSAFTFINPYGVGIWREVYSSVSDASLRFQIIEWMPALTMFDLSMVFLIGISGGLLYKYKDKFLLEELGLYLAFLLQALASRRHLPLWVLIALPLTIRAINYLWKDAKRAKGGTFRFRKIYNIGLILSFVVFVLQIALSLNEAVFLKEKFYPKGAIVYLQNNRAPGEIFSEYGWGGYLIWKLPEKKVFIDGRMPSWRWENPPSGELSSAYDTYNDILSGGSDYKEFFQMFNIQTVLISAPKEESPWDKIYNQILDYLAAFGFERQDFSLSDELEKDGWNKVYEDEIAVIFQKGKPD